MSFCYEETTNKTSLVTTLKGVSKVFLWSFTEESKCVSTFVGDRVTVLTWSPTSSILYVGTGDGDVIKLNVSNSPTLAFIEPDTEPVVSTRMYGQVVAVKESPHQDRVLVVYSSRVYMVKNKESGEFHVHETKRDPVDAWWKDNDNFFILSKNGIYIVIEYKPATRNYFVERNERISVENTDITKAQRVVLPTRETVIASAGYSYVLQGCDKSQVIKMFYMKSQGGTDYPLHPFTDPVMDFVLQLNKKTKESSLLIVLTESKILLVNPTEGKFEKKTDVLQCQRYDQLDAGYPYITPPVTSLHYYGECSERFMAEAALILPSLIAEKSIATPELVVIGHSDGSIRLWLCYCIDESLSFKPLRMVVNTEDYFEEQQQKILSAVSHVKVIDSQYLLVIKESGRVLLLSLWRISAIKPHSQEIVLRRGYHGPSNPPGILKTPPPHFHPHNEQQTHIQLLQHFSCHYQSECDQPLEPVTVNCLDYNEQMGMLAVGTEKCLAVIDTKKNMLVQVIRSENKLLKLCLHLDKHKQNCSVENCDVVCLETAMISWEDNEDAQHTLWVGTRGGTLGALNIIRESGQVLELKATGLGKHFKKSIKGIHFHQYMKQLEKHVPATNFNFDEGVIDFYSTILVVTTEKYFQTYRIPGPKEKTKDLDHGGMMWSGLIQCQGKPFIVYVTKDGHKLAGYNMTDYNHISKSLPAHCLPMEKDLFSSNGKHAVIKCSDQFYYIMDNA